MKYMKNVKKLCIVAMTLMLAAAVFAGCAAKQQPENPPKYTIYCGLNDADAGKQVISVEEAQQTARKIVTDKGFGYTEFVAYGAYVENGTVFENDTLVYEFYFNNKDDVAKVADEIKKTLNLSSVLIAEGGTDYYMN